MVQTFIPQDSLLDDAKRIVQEQRNRLMAEPDIEYAEEGPGKYEFRTARNYRVRVQFLHDNQASLHWWVAQRTDDSVPHVHSEPLYDGRSLRMFQKHLVEALQPLQSFPQERVINPKGQWLVKLFGVLIGLFIFTSTKVLAVLRPELNLELFRSDPSEELLQWQRIMAGIGPGGFGEVLLGSIVFNLGAALACIAVVAMVVFFWTTPLTANRHDLLSPWAVMLIFVPIICILIAATFLPWYVWVLMTVSLVVFFGIWFLPISWISVVHQARSSARDIRRLVSQDPTLSDENWRIDLGGWHPREFTTSEIADLVILHGDRCHRYLLRDTTHGGQTILTSANVAELGGELLKVRVQNPEHPQDTVFAVAEERLSRRRRLSRIRQNILGPVLVIFGMSCVGWLALDEVPWQPPMCVEANGTQIRGYILADNPSLLLDEASRTPRIVQEDSTEFVC